MVKKIVIKFESEQSTSDISNALTKVAMEHLDSIAIKPITWTIK
jgi:hypothetical protein